MENLKLTIEIDSQKSIIVRNLQDGNVNLVVNNLGITMPVKMTIKQLSNLAEQLQNFAKCLK